MKIFTLQNSELVAQEKPLVDLNVALHASREEALVRLDNFDVEFYAKSRNSLDGGVSKLSQYVEHGLLSIEDFLEHIEKTQSHKHEESLLKQLYWREFFLSTYEESPQKIWQDCEPYKTGFCADEYADTLAEDIQNASTGIALVDTLVKELQDNGYLHNHARLYLAAYIVHFRRIKWQAGARWMLGLLNDGNIGVNNLSWQWVASTNSNKPYIFNWENVEKFAASYRFKRHEHQIFDASYEVLQERLFKEEKQGV